MTEPKAKAEMKFPERAHLRPDHRLGFSRGDAVEYLSLQEHNAILAEKVAEHEQEMLRQRERMLVNRKADIADAVAEARAEAFEDVVGENKE